MPKLFEGVREGSWGWRQSLGHIAGLRLWWQLSRGEALPKGTAFHVRLPGYAHPITLRAHTSDVHSLVQTFRERELDVAVRNQPAVIVDAGANIGLTTVFLAQRFPNARVIALEVDKDNLRILKQNTARHPNVEILPMGLWSRKARVRIVNPDADAWSFRVVETQPDDPMGIDAVGLQDLMQMFAIDHIDFLKMDIEGSEIEVLGERSDAWIDRIGVLVIETHDRFRPGCTAALESALRGRDVAQVDHGEYTVVTFRGRSASCGPSRRHV